MWASFLNTFVCEPSSLQKIYIFAWGATYENITWHGAQPTDIIFTRGTLRKGIN